MFWAISNHLSFFLNEYMTKFTYYNLDFVTFNRSRTYYRLKLSHVILSKSEFIMQSQAKTRRVVMRKRIFI